MPPFVSAVVLEKEVGRPLHLIQKFEINQFRSLPAHVPGLLLFLPCTHIIYAPRADKYVTLRITQNLKSEKDANIMSKEYIPVVTADTAYYEPETQEEFDQLMDIVKVGDMVCSKWIFSGSIWNHCIAQSLS